MKKRLVAVIAVLATAAAAATASAQIVGTTLEDDQVEMGAAYKWFHRDLEPYQPIEKRWEVATLFVRYGAGRRLTLIAEGGLSLVEHDDFPGLDYRRYALGLGATALLFERGDWSVCGSFHANEVWDHDNSHFRFHKRTYGFLGGVHVARVFEVLDQEVGVWTGMFYIEDTAETYPWDSRRALRSESDGGVAAALGGRVVLFDDLSGFAQMVYADYAQWRIGAALMINGEEQ